MFAETEAFSGFAVKDLDAARSFYAQTLGMGIEEMPEMGGHMFRLKIAGSRDVLVYHKPDHTPATYTILNFPVDDLDGCVDELISRGVGFEKYDGFDQDDRGVAAGEPRVGWFTDPSGNILSVMTSS